MARLAQRLPAWPTAQAFIVMYIRLASGRPIICPVYVWKLLYHLINLGCSQYSCFVYKHGRCTDCYKSHRGPAQLISITDQQLSLCVCVCVNQGGKVITAAS